jgi:CRISPR-associated protein Cmr3
MARYLITLRPLDFYFFGGAITFGDGGNLNYLVKSEKLPQQTTILGMLRKEILKQYGPYHENINDYTNEEKVQIFDRIGKFPFSEKGPNDFGAIKSVSPVFLIDGKKQYIPVPLDFEIIYKSNNRTGIYGSNATANDKSFIPVLEKDEAMKGLPRGFIAADGKSRIKNDEDKDEGIFQPVERVGIRKNPTGGAEEEAYYKQTRYMLKGDFRFAIIVESDLEFKNNIVEMGGERSTFEMTAKTSSFIYSDIFKNVYAPINGVLLFADSFAPANIYDLCEFAITEIISFQHFSDLSKNIERSPIYYLIKRGSVIYGNAVKIERALDRPHLAKVGFNIIQTINREERL